MSHRQQQAKPTVTRSVNRTGDIDRSVRLVKSTMDVDLSRQLHDWAIKEMQFQPTGRYANTPLPTPEDLKKICRGSDLIDIWKFVLSRVRSLQTVKKVEENLALKKHIDQVSARRRAGSPANQHSQNLLDRRAQLSDELSASLKDVGHLEGDFHRLQQDLIQTEQEYQKTVARIQDIRRQAGLLTVKSEIDTETMMEYKEFRERITQKIDFFTSKTKYDEKRATLYRKQTAADQPENARIETACCYQVGETCEGIELFLQDTLQGTFTEADTSFRSRQEDLSFRVDEVLTTFPVSDVVQALISNTSSSSVALRERTLQINIKEDVEKLKFKYEKGGQLTDISTPVTLLRSVHELIEKGQREHVDRFMESQDHLNAARRMHRQTEEMRIQLDHTLKKLFEKKPGNLELAKKLLETELQLAEDRSRVSCLVDEGNSLKEQIHSASKEKEFLIAQYQKIKYFKDVAHRKQNLIQVLAKQNASARPRLDAQKTEIVRYVQDSLSTHHTDTVTLARRLDGGVIAEIEKMTHLSIPYLMTTYLDSSTKIPVVDLSIHHASHPISSTARPSLQKTLQNLNFPYEKAAECILPHCLELKSRLLEADRLTFDLKLTNKKIRRMESDGEDSVHNITGLCDKVTEYYEKETAQLVPLLQNHVTKATSALSDCIQTKDHLEAWWELPAQDLVPWVAVNGQAYQQWLNKWRMIVTELRRQQTEP